MKEQQVVIKRCDPCTFTAVAHEPSRKAAEGLEWYHIALPRGGSSWAEQREWTKGVLPMIIENLRSPDTAVVLGFYGPFLPDDLIAIISALVDSDSGARFYLAPIESMTGGPGYVYESFAIEYVDGCLQRLFAKAGRTFGGTYNQMAVYCVPREKFDEAVHASLQMGSLFGRELPEEDRRVVASCIFLILLNQDFDVITVAVRAPRGPQLLEVLRSLWPNSVVIDASKPEDRPNRGAPS